MNNKILEKKSLAFKVGGRDYDIFLHALRKCKKELANAKSNEEKAIDLEQK